MTTGTKSCNSVPPAEMAAVLRNLRNQTRRRRPGRQRIPGLASRGRTPRGFADPSEKIDKKDSPAYRVVRTSHGSVERMLTFAADRKMPLEKHENRCLMCGTPCYQGNCPNCD